MKQKRKYTSASDVLGVFELNPDGNYIAVKAFYKNKMKWENVQFGVKLNNYLNDEDFTNPREISEEELFLEVI